MSVIYQLREAQRGNCSKFKPAALETKRKGKNKKLVDKELLLILKCYINKNMQVYTNTEMLESL